VLLHSTTAQFSHRPLCPYHFTISVSLSNLQTWSRDTNWIRPRVGAANPLFSLWRALWRPSAPASRTKSHRTTEVSRTNKMYASTTVLLSCATCRLDQFFQILVLDFRRHVVFFFSSFHFKYFIDNSSQVELPLNAWT
jgi:hypothetical protein